MYQLTCVFVLSPNISFNLSSILTGWLDFWIIWLRRTTSCGVIQWLPQFVTWTSLRCHFNFSTMRFITIWNRNMFDMFGCFDFSHLLARPKSKLEKGWVSSLDEMVIILFRFWETTKLPHQLLWKWSYSNSALVGMVSSRDPFKGWVTPSKVEWPSTWWFFPRFVCHFYPGSFWN